IDGSLEDFIEKRKQLNLLTDEAVDQAKQFNLLWGGTVTVLKTAKASFAAFLGEALSPTLEEFLNWVRANRELIKLKIAEWAEKVGRFLEIVFRALKWGVFVLERVIDAFGGLENILAAVAGLVIGIGLVKMIRLFQTLIPIVLAAARAFTLLQLAALGKWALIIGLIALVGLAINSLVRWFQGRDSLIGDIGAKIAEQLDIWIQALADFFGFSKEEFDFWLVNFVDSVASAFGMAWDHIAEFFANLQRMDWQDVTDVWGFIWAGFIDGLTAKWASFITWFSSTVPGLTSVANTMWGVMRKIPGLQSFLPTISPGEMVSNASKIVSQAQTQQRPSAAAQRAVASAQAIRNTVNNVQSSRGGMGPITMNITQNAGESGEAL
ncbi:MAG: hypothetical protein KAT00_12030, partial [Planctomycetes bacterium]|nr:hypothetical protein [Planctomycetota bacterium]